MLVNILQALGDPEVLIINASMYIIRRLIFTSLRHLNRTYSSKVEQIFTRYFILQANDIPYHMNIIG